MSEYKGSKEHREKGLTTKFDQEEPTDTKAEANALSRKIIGAAIEVHSTLGPGLLESTYEECLCHELTFRRIQFKRQVQFALRYKGLTLDCGYRIDLLVEELIVVELKAVDHLEPIHEAQLLTYLKLQDLWLGLLLNFNVRLMKDGIKRLVQG
jgi:GxxExxY protein